VLEKSELAQLIIDGDAAGRLIPTILDLEHKDRKRELGSFLAEMHNSGEIALLSDANLEAIRELEHNDFWMVFGALSDAIEHARDQFPAVQRYAECLVEKAGDDGASNMPFVAFIRWCEKHASQATKIASGPIAQSRASMRLKRTARATTLPYGRSVSRRTSLSIAFATRIAPFAIPGPDLRVTFSCRLRTCSRVSLSTGRDARSLSGPSTMER